MPVSRLKPRGGCWAARYEKTEAEMLSDRGRDNDMVKQVCFVLPCLLLMFFLTACSTDKASGVATSTADSGSLVTDGRVVESLGIKIKGLRLSSAGYMLDFRYRITDMDKAADLMDAKIKPYLVVKSTGEKLEIPDTPKLGLLRQRPTNNSSMKKDRDYFIMFSNLGGRLKPGDQVSLVIGNTKIENLQIE